MLFCIFIINHCITSTLKRKLQEFCAISMFGTGSATGCEQTAAEKAVFDHTKQKKSIRVCGKLKCRSCRQIQTSWKLQHQFSLGAQHWEHSPNHIAHPD